MKLFDLFHSSPEQTTEIASQNGKMQPIAVEDGSRLQYPCISCLSSVRIRWQSKTDAAQFRDPEPQTTEFPQQKGFTAAGKHYSSIRKLCTDNADVTTDIYGRRVYCYRERFPCFDSYDYASEDRFFRWFVLCENDRFTRIQYTDTSETVFVTEDVGELEKKLWNGMNQAGFFAL